MSDLDPRPSARVVDRARSPRESLRMILEPTHRALQSSGGSVASAAQALRQGICDYLQNRCLRGHARRVAFYAERVAERLGLASDERESLRVAAFLHDLGKVGVPTELLLRPGALAPDERRIVEQHPVIGSRLLASLDAPGDIALALRHHHEWWNGRGYPDGICAERIPLAARIIAVADAFDAMTSDRPYRRALAREAAVAELRRYAGIQFDAAIATEFLACLDAAPCVLDPALPSQPAGAAAPHAA
jgi:HD-GYP domain-containing protein (c-di-GMP phosphodiesterase class II)